MFYGQNNNNTNDAVSTNTTIITLYSDISSLTIGAWNEKINLKFNPAVGKDGNGLTQYDRENRKSTAISQVNATTLLEQINKKIMPMLHGEKEKEPTTVGILIGNPSSRNSIILEYKPSETGEYVFYLTFLQNVGADGTSTPSGKISYAFNTTDVAESYDSNLDALVIDENKEQGEFLLFVNILKRHGDILPMISHSMRYSREIGKKYANNNSNGYNNMNNQMNGNYGMSNNGFDMGEGLPFQ